MKSWGLRKISSCVKNNTISNVNTELLLEKTQVEAFIKLHYMFMVCPGGNQYITHHSGLVRSMKN